MLVENNAGQASSEASQQLGDIAPISVFNEPVRVQSEDEDDSFIPVDWMGTENAHDSNPTHTSATAQQQTQASATAPAQADTTAAAAQTKPSDELVFEDDAPAPAASVEEDDELINKLKEKGYKIERDEEAPQDRVQELELKRIDAFLADANKFITGSDSLIVKEKLRSDLANKYAQAGKQHLIGSEEFDIDLDADFSEYEDNETMKKLYADSIRRDVKELINKNEVDKNKIVSAKEQAIQQKIQENKNKLQESFKAINTQGFLGIQVTPEKLQESYKYVTSGEFAKKVNENPSLVAEFATYILNREDVISRIGGPTYGEGVKAAVDALAGNEKTATKSPLVQAIQHSSSAPAGSIAKKQAWATPVVVEEEKKEPSHVAGKVKDYL